MSRKIIKGVPPPVPRPAQRTSLDELVALAKSMGVDDAVLLRNSEAQTMRVILAAQGFECATDGYRSPDKTRILVFKLSPHDPGISESVLRVGAPAEPVA